MPSFRIVQCDASGAPVEPLAAMPTELAANCEASAALYARIGFHPPWVSYVSVADGVGVGGCAFVGAPRDGRVEIAYFTLPEHEKHGFARQSAAALVTLAQTAVSHVTLFAKTLPEANASTAILSRLGFVHVGEAHDEDVGAAWLWELALTSER